MSRPKSLIPCKVVKADVACAVDKLATEFRIFAAPPSIAELTLRNSLFKILFKSPEAT